MRCSIWAALWRVLEGNAPIMESGLCASRSVMVCLLCAIVEEAIARRRVDEWAESGAAIPIGRVWRWATMVRSTM